MYHLDFSKKALYAINTIRRGLSFMHTHEKKFMHRVACKFERICYRAFKNYWRGFEKILLPLSKKNLTFTEKFLYYLGKICFIPLFLISGVFAVVIGFIGLFLRAYTKQTPQKLQTKIIYPPIIHKLPKEIGVVSSEYQVSGEANLTHSSWHQWEHSKTPYLHRPHILHGHRSGKALDFWNHPEKLLNKAEELHLKYFRFSIEWSLIEPEEGQFSQKALNHYKQLVTSLKSRRMQAWAVLHHFSDPDWFLEKGGFEKEENIAYYLKFVDWVFQQLYPDITKWSTFNEPTSYAFQGYVRGVYPPGKHNVRLSGVVLKNLIQAHIRAYILCKSYPETTKCEIGLTHNVLKFRPYSLNPVEHIASYYATKMMHTCFHQFLKTGVFRYEIPFQANEVLEIKDPKQYFDYIGIQYYSEPLVKVSWKIPFIHSAAYPGETMTKMPYRMFPEGLADAIEECDQLGIPIYISEVGVDTEENKRIEYFDKIFKIVSRAIEKGSDIRGVYIWTLQDNFEWDYGWNNHFGLYTFDPKSGKDQKRQVADFIKKLAMETEKSDTPTEKRHVS